MQDWNRIYGPAGFLQYQFAVPNEAAHMVPRTLEALRQAGAPSFLTVLKRFGHSNRAPMSFPIPGWTLAVDLPAAVPGLPKALVRLDQEVTASGGRIYLAKDSRMRAECLFRSYASLEAWAALAGHFSDSKVISALGSRLHLAAPLSIENHE